MATYTDWITRCGSFNIAEKRALVNAFRDSGGSLTPTAAPVALTNSTGQVGNNTVAAVPTVVAADAVITDAAKLSSTNSALLIVNADLADLADKLNAMRTALITAGILT